MKDCECPYCGSEIEICHDDGYGYEEDHTYKQECYNCGKTFTYTTSISFSYDTAKADCLNEGGKHIWKPTRTFPRCATRMCCTTCDEMRDPTEEEKKTYAIPSYKEYLDSFKDKGESL